MESKDFFGAPDPSEELQKPSILSVVVEQCVSEFAPIYTHLTGDLWSVSADGSNALVIKTEEVRQDIASWVRELEGDSPVGERIVTLLRGNKGWETIIATRVIRELYRWAGTA